jgi:hypothetical protein
MALSFQNLNPQSRVWVFQADRFLTDSELSFIQEQLTGFLTVWASHGTPMKSAFYIKDACLVVVALDENIQAASGCSISALTDLFKAFDSKFNLSFFNRFSIAHKTGSKVTLSTVNDFKDLIKMGKVNAETLVYNNLVTVKNELDTHWEIPLKNSWQKRYL